MEVKFGEGTTEYGPGVSIMLTGDEVARAVYTYLMAHRVLIDGPATIRINGELIEEGEVYVDPSGCVVHKHTRYTGRGHKI